MIPGTRYDEVNGKKMAKRYDNRQEKVEIIRKK